MKKSMMLVLGLGVLALVAFKVLALDSAIAAPKASCPGLDRPCADGYYNAPNLQRTITGVMTLERIPNSYVGKRPFGFPKTRKVCPPIRLESALMSSGDPQIRDQAQNSYSAMRVAVATTDPINHTNCGIGEIGWVKSPTHYNDQHRHVYITYHWEECAPNGQGTTIDTPIVLADGDYSPHDYRVTEKQKDPTLWRFRYDVNAYTKKIRMDFQKTLNVGCGGGVSSDQNAIGLSTCNNVAYANNDWSQWVLVPSHKKRVVAPYWVGNINASTWQAGGHNE
ncbi:MAG: hypothetical protein HY741_03025 [Chloroflexi bacterium]|nr:hypothetical protein [Chloroflexota bacterium]